MVTLVYVVGCVVELERSVPWVDPRKKKMLRTSSVSRHKASRIECAPALLVILYPRVFVRRADVDNILMWLRSVLNFCVARDEYTEEMAVLHVLFDLLSFALLFL